MTFTFNLIDEPWIPCTLLPDGRIQDLSLGEIFGRAAEVREIRDGSPLVTVSIHRLLLAILHRTHGPASTEAWECLWNAGAFNTEQINRYLREWRARFDLFDPDRPFYQTTEVHPEYAHSIAQMVYGMTLGNYSTLFDHNRSDRPPELSPAEAARQLLAFQNFAVGGLSTYQSKHGEPANPYKYAQNSLLTKGAVVLARGGHLFETLMLNLHRYSSSAPFALDLEHDLAAWERDTPARAEDRLPDGYIDLLTWQSRRVRLIPQMADDGSTIVGKAVVMKGHQFPAGDIHLRDYEPLLAFYHNPQATKTQDPWPALSLKTDRALWRDSTALYYTTGAEYQRPRILNWIAELTADGAIHRGTTYQIDIYGIATHRASVGLWRHEQLPLPLDLIGDQQRVHEVRRALEIANDVSGLFSAQFREIPVSGGEKPRNLPSPMQVLAENLLTMRDGASPDRNAVRQLADSLTPGDTYWSRLETPYKRFLQTLCSTNPHSARLQWAGEVRRAAQEAWEPLARSINTSARALKATALANGAFAFQLHALLNPYAPPREEG